MASNLIAMASNVIAMAMASNVIAMASKVVVILAFTLYLDLGSTVLSAWTGFYGTVIAVLNCWLMFGLYPEGVTWRWPKTGKDWKRSSFPSK